MSSQIPRDPHGRGEWINDYLDRRGLARPATAGALSPQQAIFARSMEVFAQVMKNIGNPLLRALKTPSEYQKDATEDLLISEFTKRFNTMSKDELVFLIAAINTQELEKRMRQIVEQGRIGDNFGKKID